MEVAFDGFPGALLVLLIGHYLDKRRSPTQDRDNGPWRKRGSGTVTKIGLGVLFASMCFAIIDGTIYVSKARTGHVVPTHDAGPVPSATPPPIKPAVPIRRQVTIAQRVTVIIARQLDLNPAEIKPDDDFEMNLGADPASVYFVFDQLETNTK